jgi:formyltetrahydrofolate synthetase
MVKFFFYNKLTNIELIKKININFEIYDGYTIIQNYDIENNILEINNKSSKNNKLLYGKIVNFDMTLDDIIKKIYEIDECKLENKIKYSLQEIWTNKTAGGTYKAYIIY